MEMEQSGEKMVYVREFVFQFSMNAIMIISLENKMSQIEWKMFQEKYGKVLVAQCGKQNNNFTKNIHNLVPRNYKIMLDYVSRRMLYQLIANQFTFK